MQNEERSSHYGESTRPRALVKTCQVYTEWLLGLRPDIGLQPPKGKSPLLVYSGMSGIAHATTVATQLTMLNEDFHFGMIYVRKETEKHHNHPRPGGIETSFTDEDYHSLVSVLKSGSRIYYPVFIDDFVESGATFKHCQEGVLARLNKTLDPPEVEALMWKPEEWYGLFHPYGSKLRTVWKDASQIELKCPFRFREFLDPEDKED